MTSNPQVTQLAVDGGEPLRSRPFPARYLGASLLGDEELALLTEVVCNRLPFREYGDGQPHMVKDFEAEACALFGVKHALATATGSGSFVCAMAGLGIGPGDEVIIPAFAWHTDFMAPATMGALPVFADIDASLNIDPDDVRRKITPRTKAIITVHFQGGPARLDELKQIADDADVALVEDVAQAAGARYHGRRLGSIGQVSCFSLQQNKVFTTGDGGLMLTNDPVVFERAARYHDLGNMRGGLAIQLEQEATQGAFVGLQYRMNEFTGAVALAQLRKLDHGILDVTRRHAGRLREQVAARCPGLTQRVTGDDAGDAGIAFYMDLGSAQQASAFSKALAAEGIPIGATSGCTNLLNLEAIANKAMAHPAMPPFGKGCAGEHVRYAADDYPQAGSVPARMVCVAVVPRYTDEDMDDVIEAIVKVWSHDGPWH